MRVLIAITLISAIFQMANGLDCYVCADADGYDGESSNLGNCWSVISGTTNSDTCSGSGTDYCLTTFTIKDGVTTALARSCGDTSGDHDTNSAAIPTTNQCVTTLDASGNPSDTTICYLHCSGTNDCNSQASSGLTACTSTCNVANSGGTCNYLTGECVCDTASFTGADCTTAVTTTVTAQRQCSQCSSETDSNCASSPPAATNCPAQQAYCSTATTTIYNSAGAAVRTVTSRGCTATKKMVDECTFSLIDQDPPLNDAQLGYGEITCQSTCDTDGCNTNTANGVVDGNEAVTMYCVQCSATDDPVGNGACATSTTRSICPSGTTHCKATVIYLIHNQTDLTSPTTPVHRVQSIVRECASAAVTTACTEANFAGLTSVKQVTCTETCTEDGCNDGWPARPKCVTCSSSNMLNSEALYTNGYDECLENPPDAAMCSMPYHAYCVTKETGIQKSDRRASAMGFRRRIERACYAMDLGETCTSETIRNVEIDNCNYTCTTDGCNQGTSGGIVHVQTMIAVMVPAILGWLMQTFL